MSEWIGIGASLCIAYRDTVVTPRTLAIQLPDFPYSCGYADKETAREYVLTELRKMCYSHVIVDKDDTLIENAARAGWPLDRLIIRMNSVGAIREQYRWPKDDGEEPLYRLYYECGLVYIPECGWFRITELDAPNYSSMSESEWMPLAERYRSIEASLSEIAKRVGCRGAAALDGVSIISDPKELKPCFEHLMDTWLNHLLQIYQRLSGVQGTDAHPYAIYFDEPQKTGVAHVQRMELSALLQVIHSKASANHPLYRGTHSLFTVIANYGLSVEIFGGRIDYVVIDGNRIDFPNYLSEWSAYADFVFPNYYRHGYSLAGPATYDQRDLWERDRNILGNKMNGAFISILEDHIRHLRNRDFRPSEVAGLFAKAKELGLQHLWVFPGSEEQWRSIEVLFSKSRCELFLEYAREICDLQEQAGWIREGKSERVKLYCRYFPDCAKCEGHPPESAVWTTERPRNFPDEEELLAPFIVKRRSRISIEDAMWAGRREVTSTE